MPCFTLHTENLMSLLGQALGTCMEIVETNLL
jgi:hypothetical protein